MYCGLGSPDLPRLDCLGETKLQRCAVPTRHAEIAALAQQAAARFKIRRLRRATLVVIRHRLRPATKDRNFQDFALCGERPCLQCLAAAKAVGIRHIVFVAPPGGLRDSCELRRARITDMRADPSYGQAWLEAA